MAIDQKTGFPFASTDIHYRVHDKNMLRVGAIYTGTANSVAAEMLIVASATAECHIFIEAAGVGDILAEIRNITAVSTTGTDIITPMNFHSEGADTATTKFYKTPTGATGTIWTQQYIPGGGRKTAAGSSGRTGVEYIMEDGSFLFRVHNLAGTASMLMIAAEFYEIRES